ncbi:hypothetical protein [Bythopirellula goksoeyrii]|uniref:Carboxypeptidase regulatory-like domain-containing protein n=1 Tax=Bythopirellula goksoeyrii TaxID=1400387 RepID=A0A5B9Q2G0_9BACT|nr:hypothetical protein [Bythopirellula goksoeyrii]QEG33207.1 hypothetical protein Pr1d_04680 [Bythopirellula goksoeyrii]
MSKCHYSTTVCLGLIFLLLGCGKSTLATYPVSGEVVLEDGSTLRNGGKVVFQQLDSDSPLTATGYFGEDGKYSLTTFDKDDGAPAGEYVVMVVPTIPDDTDGLSARERREVRNPIDSKFKNSKSSGLHFTVSPDTSPHEFRIEVTRPRIRR